ncbi:helix-turn-helix transcriptional regulator [Nonomuraea sp. B19D2]|uniref:helix-turn-helix transcriptional regulator n=1 Tax=Nonomuraea sp. B19D2 TaxID=3159561 RepID=UPI0032DAAB28
MRLEAVGISQEAEEIYRFFLRRDGDEVGSIRQALDLDPDSVEAAVESLGELGLLDLKDRHHVVAEDPRIAIERLVEQRIEELNQEIRRVMAAREAINSLVEDRRRGTERDTTLAIERIEGVDRVRRQIDDLAFFSYTEVLCLHPGGGLSKAAIETARLADTRLLRRGLTVKSIYHPQALDVPHLVSYLGEFTQLGGQVRITEERMDRMVVFDRSVAVVPVDPKESSRGALLVREPGLVSQLVIYFDGLWEAADEFGGRHGEIDDGPGLSDLERSVLTALASADKDEIAARDLGISVRTYRRYVADLMSRLGAVNRFQAALRAKEENWI